MFKNGIFSHKQDLFKSRNTLIISIILLLLNIASQGQVTPFKKSVLDSIQQNSFNLSVAFVFNTGKDGTSSLTTGTDIGVLYTAHRSSFQLLESSYFDRVDNFSTSNRFSSLFTASLFNHDTSTRRLIEKKWYAEPYTYLLYDANRGINYRWQLGINTIYAFKPTKVFRCKAGAGILYEMENWQMIRHDELPNLDTLSDAEKQYVFETIGITEEGKLARNNFRANVFGNIMCSFTKNINLNAFLWVQMPFVSPYKNLPQINVFPVVTKLYPRCSANINFSITLWEKLSFITSFTFQYDKGQIPTYVPNLVYALSEGLQFEL